MIQRLLLLLLIINSYLTADFIGGEINVGYLFHKSTGNIGYKDKTLSFQDDLRFSLNDKKENHLFIKMYLEHPLPLIPNVKIGYDTFQYTGGGQSKNEISFGTKNLFELNKDKNKTSTEYNLETIDIAFYYELLDNYVTIDIGLMLKEIKLDITVRETGTKDIEKGTLNKFYPLLYTKFAFEIPTTNISLKAEQDILKVKDILLLSLDLSIRYEFKFGLGAELGYKLNKIKLDSKTNSFDKIDLTSKGYYLAIIWDF